MFTSRYILYLLFITSAVGVGVNNQKPRIILKPAIKTTTKSKQQPVIPIPEGPTLVQRKDVAHVYGGFKIRGSIHVHAPTRTEGAPWPKPKFYESSKPGFFEIDPASFKVRVQGHFGKILLFNLERFWRHVFHKSFLDADHLVDNYNMTEIFSLNNKTNVLHILDVTILNNNTTHYPTIQMDESYTLNTLRRGVISLVAQEVWGVIRGLDTLSQLIVQNKHEYRLSHFKIEDKPRFPYRGVLIDTSRHFIQKAVLIQNLEAMAQNKLNVFHWHIIDDHSFPYESINLPNITKYGAYDADHIYTQKDIADIIEEARLRGIRVIPEIDTPGHTLSWGYGQPGILTPCYAYGMPNGQFGPMNPLRNKTYQVLDGIFSEVLEVFPDHMIHIGGDEVYPECWRSNPEMQRDKDYRTLGITATLKKYSEKLQKIIKKLAGQNDKEDLRMIAWQEAYDERRELTKDTIIQIWKQPSYYISQVLASGYDALFSQCWYLDSSVYGVDWIKFYQCLDREIAKPSKSSGSLLGGTICMWTEYVDSDALLTKLWPRASAAAERLWSPPQSSDMNEAGRRIEEQYCRLKRRGIRAGSLSGPGNCDNYTVNFYIPLASDWEKQRSEKTKLNLTLPDMFIAKQLFARYERNPSESYLQIMIPIWMISVSILCITAVKLLTLFSYKSRNNSCSVLSIALSFSLIINIIFIGYIYLVLPFN